MTAVGEGAGGGSVGGILEIEMGGLSPAWQPQYWPGQRSATPPQSEGPWMTRYGEELFRPAGRTESRGVLFWFLVQAFKLTMQGSIWIGWVMLFS